jgi:hypothetical protein
MEWPQIDAQHSESVLAEMASPLCGRLLTQCLGQGGNILVLGPQGPSVRLIQALVGPARRPALIGMPGELPPPAWASGSQFAEVAALVADRLAAWSLPVPRLVAAMQRFCGVAGWLAAPSLERGLMRFELGAARLRRRPVDAPLQVLCAVDLVALVSERPHPRLLALHEICLVDSGYRPNLLFTVGQTPVPLALQPVAEPLLAATWRDEASVALAEELRAASRGGDPDLDPLLSPGSSVGSGSSGPRGPAQAPAGGAAITRPARRTATPVLPPADGPEMSSPGWELDQLLPVGLGGAAAAGPSLIPGSSSSPALAPTAEPLAAPDLDAPDGLEPPPAPPIRP